jgi:hypothetical protein
VSTASAIIRIELAHGFDIHFVKRLLNQYWAEFVATYTHASAASYALVLFDFFRGECFGSGQFGFFGFGCGFEFADSVKHWCR